MQCAEEFQRNSQLVSVFGSSGRVIEWAALIRGMYDEEWGPGWKRMCEI